MPCSATIPRMKSSKRSPIAALLITLFVVYPALATCGGGGGGGVGGMSSGGAQVYYVPWKVRSPKDPPATAGMVLYWFPLTNEELKKSSLRESRALSLYATQCISMELGDYRTPGVQKLIGDSKPPLAVLATPDGTTINRSQTETAF
jgi:hypothetical protein